MILDWNTVTYWNRPKDYSGLCGLKWYGSVKAAMESRKPGTTKPPVQNTRFANYNGLYNENIMNNLNFFETYPLVAGTHTWTEFKATPVPYSTVNLVNSDFANGTIRIRHPGYYILQENIIFSPNPNDDFMPTAAQIAGGAAAEYPVAPFGGFHLGFFAAITIEANDVILNLNGKILRQSSVFNVLQRFYAHIELANTPFVPPQGPADFGDIVKSANRAYIMNGSLGLSSHHGIHGNSMKNIIIENLNIFSYEVAAIALNGGENILVKYIQVCNISTDIKVISTFSQARFIRTFLKAIETRDSRISLELSTGTKTISEIITELEAEMALVKTAVETKQPLPDSIFKNVSQKSDDNAYGFLFNPRGVAVGGFRLNRVGAIGNTNIVLHNINLENITSKSTEILGVSPGPRSGGGGAYGEGEQAGPVGDIFQIELVNNAGAYNQNILANAQLIIAESGVGSSERGRTNIQSAIIDWAKSGKKNLSSIINNTDFYYVNAHDSMGHTMKGNIGLFISAVDGMKIQDVNINNIENTGSIGNETKGDNTPYEGSTTRAVAIVGSVNVEINSINVNKINSLHGNGIGIDMLGETNNVTIDNAKVEDIHSSNYTNNGTGPNPEPLPIEVGFNSSNGDAILVNINKN